jgi:hypothetical protein
VWTENSDPNRHHTRGLSAKWSTVTSPLPLGALSDRTLSASACSQVCFVSHADTAHVDELEGSLGGFPEHPRALSGDRRGEREQAAERGAYDAGLDGGDHAGSP